MEQTDFAQAIEPSTAYPPRTWISRPGVGALLGPSLIFCSALAWWSWTMRGPAASFAVGLLLFGAGVAGRIKVESSRN